MLWRDVVDPKVRVAGQKECVWWPSIEPVLTACCLQRRPSLCHSPQSRWPEKQLRRPVSWQKQHHYGEGKFILSTWFILRWLSKTWKSSWMLGTYPDCNLDQTGTSFNEISKAPVERKWVSNMLLRKNAMRQENILFSCPHDHILGVFIPNIWKGFCPVTIKAMASSLK